VFPKALFINKFVQTINFTLTPINFGVYMSYDLYMGVSEQSKASKHRLDDARALLNAARWRGAMYMSGYAVECLIKTKLMRGYGCQNLYELEYELENELQRRGILASHATVFTHHLELLLRLTQTFDRLRQNQVLWPKFNIVNRWMPAWRYHSDLANRQEAEDFLEAVLYIMKWIENNL
jgi:HEPN domain-containing protein